MTTETLLLIILVVIIAGALPTWPYSRPWGYAPAVVMTLVLAFFLIWAIAVGRPLFRSSGTLHDAGQDLKSAGRDVADSVRRAVQ